MPLFVMIGRDGENGLARRPAARPRHLAHLEPLDRAGRILIAGPLLDPDGSTPRGSVVVFEADSLEEARKLAARDPYVIEGVFATYDVHPFKRVFPGTRT
jgi:uncharacterized protein YciI